MWLLLRRSACIRAGQSGRNLKYPRSAFSAFCLKDAMLVAGWSLFHGVGRGPIGLQAQGYSVKHGRNPWSPGYNWRLSRKQVARPHPKQTFHKEQSSGHVPKTCPQGSGRP